MPQAFVACGNDAQDLKHPVCRHGLIFGWSRKSGKAAKVTTETEGSYMRK